MDQGAAVKLEKGARVPLYGSIGPQTSDTMRKVGLQVGFEPTVPGIDELVAALIKSLE
jgi:uroporphyrinogen-III synthase